MRKAGDGGRGGLRKCVTSGVSESANPVRAPTDDRRAFQIHRRSLRQVVWGSWPAQGEQPHCLHYFETIAVISFKLLSLSLLQKHFRIWRKNLCPVNSDFVVFCATNIPNSLISSSPFNESRTVATISSDYHCEMVFSIIGFPGFFLTKLDTLPTHNVHISS